MEACDFGEGLLEAYYFELPDGACALGVQPWLSPERRRLWEMVAHGFALGASTEPHHYLFAPCEGWEVAPEILRALRLVAWAMEPRWWELAQRRRVSDNPRVIAAWCGVPLEVVLAASPRVRYL